MLQPYMRVNKDSKSLKLEKNLRFPCTVCSLEKNHAYDYILYFGERGDESCLVGGAEVAGEGDKGLDAYRRAEG